MDLPFLAMLNWFNGLSTVIKNYIFADAVAMLQSISATHTLTQDSLRAK